MPDDASATLLDGRADLPVLEALEDRLEARRQRAAARLAVASTAETVVKEGEPSARARADRKRA